MRGVILNGFSEDTFVEVKDISGGCGSMYAIEVESVDFVGVNKVKQSRMVNDLIKKEIGETMVGSIYSGYAAEGTPAPECISYHTSCSSPTPHPPTTPPCHHPSHPQETCTG